MARGRNSRGSGWSNDSAGRVSNHNATAIRAVLGAEQFYPIPAPTPVSLWSEVEDLRHYHPDGALRAPSSFPGVPSQWSVNYGPTISRRGRVLHAGLPTAHSFDSPQRVLVCVRRKIRRAVLFASGEGGSRRRFRRPRRNPNSAIRCR